MVNGPRFSSRAESQWHQQAGWSLVGMPGMPEAATARELAMCYTTVAMVTDLDAGVEHGEGVTHSEVLEVFAQAMPGFKAVSYTHLDVYKRQRRQAHTPVGVWACRLLCAGGYRMPGRTGPRPVCSARITWWVISGS